MNALIAALLTALIVSHSTGVSGADAQKSPPRTSKAKAPPRSDPPDALFSKAQKALQERAAKTAEVVRKNLANIKKRVSGDPEPPPGKTAQKSDPKDKKDKKEKRRKTP